LANQVAWVEVAGKDGEKLQGFYGSLFGGKFQKVPGRHRLLDAQSGGRRRRGVGRAQDGPGHVTFYVAAEDPQAVRDRAAQLGGKTIVPVTEMEMVTFALLAGPEGHVVGVLKGRAVKGSDPSLGLTLFTVRCDRSCTRAGLRAAYVPPE
jgi:predicted enzyme related to lactoylglutathione lyase